MSKKNAYRPTTLGYAILGLLQEEPRSGYAVRKVFEETALGQYSGSPGAIYPALRRLTEEGLVEATPSSARGANYALTRLGRSTLKGWLTLPLDPAEAPRQTQELLLRFALMGDLVEDGAREGFLTQFRTAMEAAARSLEEFEAEAGGHLPTQGRLALRHGIEGYRTDARWAEWALAELRKGDG